ncbi:MAG: ATPase, T2SS/T4P/T4SS family [Deltaproteobacteria bacterium]
MVRNPEFLKLVVSKGMLTEEDTNNLLKKYNGDAYSILTFLVSGSAAKKNELGMLWGDSLGVAYIDLSRTMMQHHVVQKLPEQFARTSKMIPVYQFGDVITIATSNPGQIIALKEAEKLVSAPVSAVFTFTEDIEDAIEIEYKSGSGLTELIDKIGMNSLFKGTTKITEDQIRKLSGDQAVIEFTQGLLLFGVKERASDIHIEPEEEMVRIRFRIDGALQERLKLDRVLMAPLISRLKIMANLDITERRRPQDGRISLSLTNRSIDFRMSSVPTIFGEKIVLRILGQVEKQKDVPDLADLDFSASLFGKLKKIIDAPNGVFFVTGPTGSGKTTTLYAVLKHLNKPIVNIMTIEDPVEYRLQGINQVQVNHLINLDFGSALRSFLRQDPDIILVGEVRDMETAKIAAQAALTGHLVLTTMHTNNALQAVTRLVEIGVEPFLVAPSIIAVMAQRLVRKICDNCKESYRLTPEQIEDYFVWDGKSEVSFYRGKGCEQCGQSGYLGRIAIHELFIMNSEIRRLVSQGASILEVQESANKSGYKAMRYDGIKKVLRGLTTIEEIDRVTVAQEEM